MTTIEERIERLKETLTKDDQKYDIIGIYEDEQAYELYGGYMEKWNNERHMIYPVSWNDEIMKMGSCLTNHVSAFFLGTRFLDDEDFKKKVIEALNSSNMDPEKIKIRKYAVTN